MKIFCVRHWKELPDDQHSCAWYSALTQKHWQSTSYLQLGGM